METTEFQSLRATTRMSTVGAAFGTLELGQTLTQHLPEKPDTDPDQDPQGEQPGGEPGDGGFGCGGQVTLDGCGDADQQRRKLRRLVRAAQERTEEDVEAAEALGCGGGYSPTGVNAGQAMDLADAVKLRKRLRSNPRLQRIAKIVGRNMRMAGGKRETRFRHGPDDVVDVECGGNLDRILPSELIALCTPGLQFDALLRYTQKRMLQTRREGVEKADKGPMVVLVDESGSMQGREDEWSKALALGIMSIAKKEKREFACGTFSETTRLSSWGKNPSMDQILEFLGRTPCGGTSFESPLDAAMTLIENAKEKEDTWAKADIVMVTDGDAYMSPDFKVRYMERAKKTGAHLYVIYVGARSYTLDSISDGTAFVPNFSNDDDAIELAFGI